MGYFKCITFCVLLVTAVTFCPPMLFALLAKELNQTGVGKNAAAETGFLYMHTPTWIESRLLSNSASIG